MQTCQVTITTHADGDGDSITTRSGMTSDTNYGKLCDELALTLAVAVCDHHPPRMGQFLAQIVDFCREDPRSWRGLEDDPTYQAETAFIAAAERVLKAWREHDAERDARIGQPNNGND